MADATPPPRWMPAVWAAGGSALTLAVVAGLWFAMPQAHGTAPDEAAMRAAVKEALLAEPEIIPEAINRLQEREVERLLASNREAIETPFAGAWAGAEDGDVVMVEFFDFNCPFCRQSSADVQRLLAEDAKLKLVFRDMPVLGPESERFARASLAAAEEGRYLEFYANVFGGQGALSQERLIRTVRQTGLNEGKVAAGLTNRRYQQEIENNLALGRALGLTGTPSYIIGNQILSGAVGYDALKDAIADARRG